VRELRELAEDDDVDGGSERRHEQRPRDAEECLFVPDDDVAPDEPEGELAVMPKLACVEVRPSAGGPDDDRPAVGLEMRLVVTTIDGDVLARQLNPGLTHLRDADDEPVKPAPRTIAKCASIAQVSAPACESRRAG
jgi:hypothetical protein